MPRARHLSPDQIRDAQASKAAGLSLRTIASGLGVSHATVARALAVRERDDYTHVAHARPRVEDPITSWTLEKIRAARDCQMRGDFKLAARLAEAARGDDSIYNARLIRLAPQDSISAEIRPVARTFRGEAVARKARASVHVHRPTLRSIASTFVDHGIAIGYTERVVVNDGERIDYYLHEWPIEHVKWDRSREQLMTTVLGGGERVPIVHGDGFWTVFQKTDRFGWIQDAAITPVGFVWAAHAEGIAHWSASAKSHGMAKVVGELPEGWALEADASGNLTPEASAFLAMLRDVVSGQAGAAVRPAGSKTEFLSNASSAWQVFSELANNRERAAARIYLGTDAILGAGSGAPGVDIAAMFGIAEGRFQGDFQTIEDAIYTGVLMPWAAENEGDTRLTPRLKYRRPDPDEQREVTDYQTRLAGFFAALEKYKSNGMLVDEIVIAELANLYGIEPPALAPVASASVPLQLAPTDVARVVRVREARAANGLLPFGDDRDDLTLGELEARTKAPPATPATQAPVA